VKSVSRPEAEPVLFSQVQESIMFSMGGDVGTGSIPAGRDPQEQREPAVEVREFSAAARPLVEVSK
jgi:hypothetical protein